MIFITDSMFFELLYDLHGFAPLGLLIFISAESCLIKMTLRGLQSSNGVPALAFTAIECPS